MSRRSAYGAPLTMSFSGHASSAKSAIAVASDGDTR